jgi:hypothetical protein
VEPPVPSERMERFLARDRHPAASKVSSEPPSLSFLSMELERVTTELEHDRSEPRRALAIAELQYIGEQLFRVAGRLRTNG